MDKVDLAAAFARFDEPWSPRVVARHNDNKVFLAKAKGAFTWHAHPETGVISSSCSQAADDRPAGRLRRARSRRALRRPPPVSGTGRGRRGASVLLIEPEGRGTGDPATAAPPSAGSDVHRLVWFVPADALDATRDAVFAAGAGVIGDYERCSWLAGTGTFLAREADPAVGSVGEEEHVPSTASRPSSPTRTWTPSPPAPGAPVRGVRLRSLPAQVAVTTDGSGLLA